MEELTLKELWRSTNLKLEEAAVINNLNREEIGRNKVQWFIASMKPMKIFTVLAGMLWVGIGSAIIVNLMSHSLSSVSPFFLVSAALQLLLTAVALAIYIYQLVLIYQADISEAVLVTQEKIATLRTSTLITTRVLVLQLPLWTTFYWSEAMFRNSGAGVIMLMVLITLIFSAAAFWLFVNIRIGNKDKKWFKIIFDGKEWTPLIKSMAVLEELKEFSGSENLRNAAQV